MESASAAAAGNVEEHAADARVHDKGLKPGAIGFLSALAIALGSTAPAYSLAVVIALIVFEAGVQTPAVLLAAFVPMFLVAWAYRYLNRADPDCGTTFSWVTRAMGPGFGWVAGWALIVTGILVIGSLAEVAAIYTYLLFGWDSAAENKDAYVALAVGYMLAMMVVCILGVQLSARTQIVLISVQILGLLLFAVSALASGDRVLDPELSWFSPFAIDSFGALAAGLLIGVFIYWGWETAVTLNEENDAPTRAPGAAGVASTVILLVTYVLVATAAVAYLGVDGFADYEEDPGILSAIAGETLGSGWDKVLIFAVAASGLASTQTTILPGSRIILSMARQGAAPTKTGEVNPRFQTPVVATVIVAVAAIAWYVGLKYTSENFLYDSIASLGLMIAFYYAITGYACAIFYRRKLLVSAKNFVQLGVMPVLGAAILTYLFVKGLVEFAKPEASTTGEDEIFGLGHPFVIGVGSLLLGVVGALGWWAFGNREFFKRRREVVSDEVAAEAGADLKQAPTGAA